MRVCNRFNIITSLASGNFGTVYIAKTILNDKIVAIKVTDMSEKDNLLYEYQVLTYLNKHKHKLNLDKVDIPNALSFGITDTCAIMSMDLLSLSLSDILDHFKVLTHTTAYTVLYWTVNLLEYIHTYHLVHRDIKPCNILIGCNENCKKIYLMDFGIAYSPPLEQVETDGFIGNALCAPIAAHMNLSQSYKDDIESAIYMFAYLTNELTWCNAERNEMIDLKLAYTNNMLEYVRNITGDIDYNHLKSLIKTNEPTVETHEYPWCNVQTLRRCINTKLNET